MNKKNNRFIFFISIIFMMVFFSKIVTAQTFSYPLQQTNNTNLYTPDSPQFDATRYNAWQSFCGSSSGTFPAGSGAAGSVTGYHSCGALYNQNYGAGVLHRYSQYVSFCHLSIAGPNNDPDTRYYSHLVGSQCIYTKSPFSSSSSSASSTSSVPDVPPPPPCEELAGDVAAIQYSLVGGAPSCQLGCEGQVLEPICISDTCTGNFLFSGLQCEGGGEEGSSSSSASSTSSAGGGSSDGSGGDGGSSSSGSSLPIDQNCGIGMVLVDLGQGIVFCKNIEDAGQGDCPQGQIGYFTESGYQCQQTCPAGQYWGQVGGSYGCKNVTNPQDPSQCGEGLISQGNINGNAVCVGTCPSGQSWGHVNGTVGCYGFTSGSSSSGEPQQGSCPSGQTQQGTVNGNPVCTGSCPSGQDWGAVNGQFGCYGTATSSSSSSAEGSASSGSNGSSSSSASSECQEGEVCEGEFIAGECNAEAPTAPKCEGEVDAIACAIAIHTWTTECNDKLWRDDLKGTDEYRDGDSVADNNNLKNRIAFDEIEFRSLTNDLQADTFLSSNCPAPERVNFSIMGRGFSIEFTFDWLCSLGELMRPFIIALGYFSAGLVLIRGIR